MNKHLLFAIVLAYLAIFTIILCYVGYQIIRTVIMILKNCGKTVHLPVEFKLKFTQHQNIKYAKFRSIFFAIRPLDINNYQKKKIANIECFPKCDCDALLERLDLKLLGL